MAARASGLVFDRIAAIPYAGLPIGVALALHMERPLIYPRREVKAHGTRRAIEGEFNPGDVALVVDDLITRGDSKVEAAAPLEANGLIVRDVLVLVDREQGGREDLARRGYTLHAVIRLAELLDVLNSERLIEKAQYDTVMSYLAETQ
jgi:uridine monophosphate synthetase